MCEVRLDAVQYLGPVDFSAPPEIGLRRVDQLDPEGHRNRE
jgi:hypothetical protein